MQKTCTTFNELLQAEIGILGEHIADYHCGVGWGWAPGWDGHDKGDVGQWKTSPDQTHLGKLSNKTKLFKLDLTPNQSGIDSVWHASSHNEGKKYAVVEAKSTLATKRLDGTTKPGIAGLLGVNGQEKAERILDPITEDADGAGSSSGKPSGGSPKGKQGGKLKGASAAGAKTKITKNQVAPNKSSNGKPVIVQMSREWIKANLRKAVGVLEDEVDGASESGVPNYSRLLFYVPMSLPSAIQHAQAQLSGTSQDQATHADHDITANFCYDETNVKKAVNTKKANLRKKLGNLTSLGNEP